jgi:hypothetical protein
MLNRTNFIVLGISLSISFIAGCEDQAHSHDEPAAKKTTATDHGHSHDEPETKTTPTTAPASDHAHGPDGKH